MIASTLVAAALASTNPAQATPMPMKTEQAGMAGQKGMATSKMDCCKDGCACCAKKDAAKAAPAK